MKPCQGGAMRHLSSKSFLSQRLLDRRHFSCHCSLATTLTGSKHVQSKIEQRCITREKQTWQSETVRSRVLPLTKTWSPFFCHTSPRSDLMGLSCLWSSVPLCMPLCLLFKTVECHKWKSNFPKLQGQLASVWGCCFCVCNSLSQQMLVGEPGTEGSRKQNY